MLCRDGTDSLTRLRGRPAEPSRHPARRGCGNATPLLPPGLAPAERRLDWGGGRGRQRRPAEWPLRRGGAGPDRPPPGRVGAAPSKPNPPWSKFTVGSFFRDNCEVRSFWGSRAQDPGSFPTGKFSGSLGGEVGWPSEWLGDMSLLDPRMGFPESQKKP